MTEQSSSKSVNPNTLLVVALVVMAFFAGYLYNKNKTLEGNPKVAGTATTQQQDATQQQPAVAIKQDKVDKIFAKGNIFFGNANSKVKIVEVSDPSCPYCHVAGGQNPELAVQVGTQFKYASDGGSYIPPVPEFKKLVDSGKAAFAVVYANGHGSGEIAMQALYCANDQNKFWEAHDLLMTNKGYELINNEVKNDKAAIPKLVDFVSAQVNPGDLTTCLESGKYASKLTSDQQLAVELGFQGTPYFIVNTTPYPGAYSYKDMQATIDSALK